MVPSVPALGTAIGAGGLPDHAAAQLLGPSVLRRVRPAAQRPTAGARGDKELSGAVLSAGLISHVLGNLFFLLQVGAVLL